MAHRKSPPFCVRATLALLLAAWISRAVLRFLPPSAAPALSNLSFRLDLRVLAFTGGMAILTCLLFRLAPALHATRSAPHRGLQERSRNWTSRVLAVCQVALCTILLTGSGLFLRTLSNLRHRESGLTQDHLVVATTNAILGLTRQQMAHDEEELRARAATIPGVRVAAFSDLPLLTGGGVEFQVEGQRDLHQPPEEMRSYRLLVSPGFFAAVGTPLLAGRDVAPQDNADNRPMVALVNESFARRFVSAGNPVGQHVRILDGQTLVDVEIIGLVKDTTAIDPREARPPMYYEPYPRDPHQRYSRAPRRWRHPSRDDGAGAHGAGDRSSMELERRRAVHRDRRSRAGNRTAGRADFGRIRRPGGAGSGHRIVRCAALGVVRRTKEIGVRIALGASRSGVHWMVAREASLLLAAGVAVGLPCALAVTRYVATMLYGLKPADAANIAVSLAAMATVSALQRSFPQIAPPKWIRWSPCAATNLIRLHTRAPRKPPLTVNRIRPSVSSATSTNCAFNFERFQISCSITETRYSWSKVAER